jgi:hypothetical protein
MPSEGVVNPASFLNGESIEWLTPDGRLQACPLDECKAVCFVSEGARADLFTEHTNFERRPKLPGIWVRFFFRDDSVLDGILPHNLVEWPLSGYMLVPPQARANRQRVFVPKQALVRTEIKGVIGGGTPAGSKPPTARDEDSVRQMTIFDS